MAFVALALTYTRQFVTTICYLSKSHLITSLSSIIFPFPIVEQCFLILFTLFVTYSIRAFTCYSPSFILYGILFVRFCRIFTVPLTPPVSITIAALFSLIFSPRTIISGRLSPFFPTLFCFYLFSSLSFFQSLTLYLYSSAISVSLFGLFHSRFLNVYRFNYNFNLYFLFKFLLFKRGFCMTFVFI